MLQYVNPLFKICYTFLRLLREIRKTSLWAFNFFTHSAILEEELFITIVFIYIYHKPIFYTIANGTNLSWIRQTFQQFLVLTSIKPPIFPIFSQYQWVTGVTDPSTKKLKTRVTSVTQQTGSNKGRSRKRWQVTLLYTLFFMTYRAKIDKRLIIRGRHPNWRVVAPMHKKKMKSKCHRHLWLSFVKFYFPFIERMVWLEILNTQESPNC